ncbi:hypothetical protein KCU88_g2005, partial [Aureobasidium melanogenum]
MSTTTTQTTSATTTLSGTAQAQDDPSYVPRGPVKASLNFFKDPADGSKPYNYINKQTEGQPQRNFGYDAIEVELSDIRDHEDNYNLDKDAFEAIKNVGPSQETEFVDDEHIKSVYYPEVERLLLDHVPGAHKVTIFDHTIRRSDPNAHRAPVTRVHVDQTARSTEWRVRKHDPDEADELLKGRFRIINVWRPINGVVQAHPLAFASAGTVSDSQDLVPVEQRYPDWSGEIAGVRYNQNQKWYYWSGMDNDERLLLKCYDSKGDGVAQRVPHSAFVDPRTPQGAKGRESIEVRALVYG